MRRVTNPTDFRIAITNARNDYENRFGPRVRAIRAKYASAAEQEVGNRCLEAHLRAYLVNRLLRNLNWCMDTEPHDNLPNMVAEAPTHVGEGRRYLDYFGFEVASGRPLLIVETKRPVSPLPALTSVRRRRGGTRPDSGEVAETLARGLAGETLAGDWPKWLSRTREYVESIVQGDGRPPRRVAMTDGEWLIIFIDPADAFLSGGRRSPEKIQCFTSWDDIVSGYVKVFEVLEHQNVLGSTPPLLPGELAGYLRAPEVDCGMHGVAVLHFEEPTLTDPIPSIRVAPLFFLRSRFGDWFQVGPTDAGERLPDTPEELRGHLECVHDHAVELRETVEKKLDRVVTIESLEAHYLDETGFAVLRGVTAGPLSRCFVVLTGIETHFLRREPTIPACPYHEWRVCNEERVAYPFEPVLVRSVSPRSFFKTGEDHHCAHRDVTSPKQTQIGTDGGRGCGARSGAAFCEIYAFEERLCCRACVFEGVCTAAEMFRALPCRPAVSAALGSV